MHSTNISDFLDASKKSQSALVQAYLGLIAIELVLKSHITLSDHDVGLGLTRFKNLKCQGKLAVKGGELTTLILRLRNDIQSISVTDKNGSARYAPQNSYPFIRYTRMSGDGWIAPSCPAADLSRLARTVQQVRAFLRLSFGLPL